MTKKTLSPIDIIQRSMTYSQDDVRPILKYLGMHENELTLKKNSSREDATKIVNHLRRMGSNDIATIARGGDGVSYDEVVYDVAKKLKAPDINKNATAEYNERQIIIKIFSEAFEKMSDDEKRFLLDSIGVSGQDIPFATSGVLIIQLMLKKYGGFAVYRTSIIVANLVSRAILGSGLSFATNAMLTRSIGLFIGPIGWIASGAWLAVDLLGPAYRKTIPAIVHIAALRQMVINRINIGIVGDGSVGKDSLFKSVFGINTENVSPIAGSTKDIEIYPLEDTGTINLINFPGFNDVKTDVNALIENHLHHTDVFLMVVDLTRGVSGVDVAILNKLKRFEHPILVCLNKVDMVRPANKESLLKTAKERLGEVDMLETAFDPDERLSQTGPIGSEEVFNWVKCKLDDAGKETDNFKKK